MRGLVPALKLLREVKLLGESPEQLFGGDAAEVHATDQGTFIVSHRGTVATSRTVVRGLIRWRRVTLRPMREPGTCPSCSADWRIGPSSKGRADVAHCQCSAAVGGVHTVNGCQQCGYSELAERCADPTRRSRAFSYERPELER